MSVYILPAELGFRRPFTVEVSETLTIKNTTPLPIAFKVKTTAPKQYCVRPNSGRIEPDRSVEVSVLLQAMKQDPPADYKCRDKFLVQSIPITGDKEFVSVQEIWDGVEKSAIQEKKIRVNFLSAEGTAEPEAVTPQRSVPTNYPDDSTSDVPPPAYGSPSGGDSYGASNTSVTAETPDNRSGSKKNLESVSPPSASSGTTANSGGASFAPGGVLSAATALTASTEHKEVTIASLKAKLAEANALIASLQDGGLRQRKAASTANPTDSTTAETAQLGQVVHGTEGVPVQIVAILSLMSFLLAYFFF
ncbi:integral er membrane protein [Grosmannia clavigera kw1407]|uniref:Integral er membrane protein n=1 Tax=Grosmannia clavigera (strain kw1407 / UAMH 11150) TaxID=655863 RepID=F0XM58_GROCL|nr:integral er membrane protein [Grosmannia clavigera kw1407]EFX01162.1 integral er membrane protein [Grosmannia clavigera kw1407]